MIAAPQPSGEAPHPENPRVVVGVRVAEGAGVLWILGMWGACGLWALDFWTDYWLKGTFAFGVPLLAACVLTVALCGVGRLSVWVRRGLAVTGLVTCFVVLTAFGLREFQASRTFCPEARALPYSAFWHAEQMPWRAHEVNACVVERIQRACYRTTEFSSPDLMVYSVHRFSRDPRTPVAQRVALIEDMHGAACAEATNPCCDAFVRKMREKDWSHLPAGSLPAMKGGAR